MGAKALNELFLKKVTSDSVGQLAEVSAVFIADRLWFDGKPRPVVTCDFSMVADFLKWSFLIKREGEADIVVGVEMTQFMLMASNMPVTYLLENEVRKELGLCDLDKTAAAWKTPIISES